MAQIQQNTGGRKDKKPRVKKKLIWVDLTPMVDLAFLLITFFMLTTSLNKPRAMELLQRIPEQSDPVSECRVLNLLADSTDHLYVYYGDDLTTLKPVKESDITPVIIEKAKLVRQTCGLDNKGKPHDIVCLIKLLPGTHYKNMIMLLDEMKITDTQLYSIQDPVAEEIAAVKDKESELLVNGH